MKNLLKFEFHKLLRQKSLYICTAVILALLLVGVVITKAVAGNPDFAAPNAVEVMLGAVSSSNFAMVCGIFIALFVCADFDQTTIKNVYSHGYSRGAVYFSKLIAALSAAAVMFALTVAAGFVAGNVTFGGNASAGGAVVPLAGQFLYVCAYAAFVFAVSISARKVGVSVALAILGPALVSTALSLVDALLKFDGFKLADYWLDGFSADLSSVLTQGARLAVCIALCAVYAAAFAAAGYVLNKKREI